VIPALAAGAAVGALAVRALTGSAESFSFRDRTVLITGGSRGLGLVLARTLIDEGARVAICGRDGETLDRARQGLAACGADVLAIPCDVTERAQVEALVDSVTRHFGQIDVLINNAGTIAVGPAELMGVEDFDAALRTNFWGPLYAILAVLPQMRRRRQGRIVNIASIGGKLSVPHLLPYSASKFALVGLSEGLRAELARAGIVVTTVCPGLMRTGSPRHALFKGHHRVEYAWFSIADALPGTSMDAMRAAREIVLACRRGEAEIVLSIPARVADKFHALFPGITATLLGLVNRLLPGPGGIGRQPVKGADSTSLLSPSILTSMGDQAAEANNQIWEPRRTGARADL
jgi:NAD(P)-dependent dehydrogenase (short-subunit alcohol dehydrogenase family)